MLLIANIAVFIKSYTLECQATHEVQKSRVAFFIDSEEAAELPTVQARNEFFNSWGFSMEDITERGDVVSLFSHMFAHGGLMHLLGNLMMLWVFGSAMEGALKSGMFSVFYVTCGVLAAVAQGAYAYGADIPCVGASGAIAGLIGGFFILFGAKAKLNVVLFYGGFVHGFPINALAVCGFWIFSQISAFVQADPSVGGVAWMAHIAGFAAGALFLAAIRNELGIELVENSTGSLDVKHEDDQPQVSEEKLLEAVLDMNSVASVATEFIGEGSKVQCSKCDGELDLSNEIGGRLLRCMTCSQITYVDAELMIRSRDAFGSANAESATV